MIARTASSALLALALVACGEGAKDIQFAKYDAPYASKPDFAWVEHKYPLTPAQRAQITPKYLAGLDQEQVDQIYARLSAGPIPDGAFDGDLFFPKGASGERRVAEIIGGLKGFAVNLKGRKVEGLGRTLWKGKVFYREQGVLRNRIEDLALLAPLVDGPLTDIPKVEVGGRDAWLLFPAKLYCGQSLLDSRRESIVIDYAFTDQVEGYREKPDFLAGRRGLRIRDEIRMVRPGFYLGRAYADRAFLLNFTLYNKETAERDGGAFEKAGVASEDCFTGTQRAAVAAK
ncbi:MAG TPA: hypothetical protein VFU53_12610 [Burkholderiales bacterium]|nr:hypothetical protein [Burkholderiales bacterium]